MTDCCTVTPRPNCVRIPSHLLRQTCVLPHPVPSPVSFRATRFRWLPSSPARRRNLALVAVALTTLAWAGCADKDKAVAGRGRGGAGAAPVFAAQVQRKIVPLVLDAIGAVEPSRTAALRCQVTGTLVKIHFREGEDVQQGDLLFEIDSRPFRNALNSAEADLQRTKVQLGTAQAQVDRYRTLNAGAMVSQEQFQSIADSARALQAQLLASESAVANAKLQLDYCSIRAPLSGRTGNLGAHEGDLVRASDANVALVVIHQLSPIYVTFGVPQQYLAALNRYRAAGPIAVSATPAAGEEIVEKGELTFIDNAVDAATGTVKIKATFANPALRLWPGQFATVHVTLDSPSALTVPTTAVQNDQRGQHVYVVKADSTAEFRDVVIERQANADSVVTKGLAEGETVIVDGQLRVLPGRPVEVKSAPAADGSAPAPGSKKSKGPGKKEKAPAS